MTYEQAVVALRQRGLTVGEGAMRKDGVVFIPITAPHGTVQVRTIEVIEMAENRCSLDHIHARRQKETLETNN